MFRITNLQTNQQETCQNRDELLSLINDRSVWTEDRGETITIQIDQLGEEGIILDSLSLSLPLESIVEEALSGFGFKREKKSFGFLKSNKQKKEKRTSVKKDKKLESIKSVEKPQNNLVEDRKDTEKMISKSVSDKPVKTRKSGFSSLVLTIVICLITIASIASIFLVQVQSKKINELENRIQLEEKQGKIEVFGRFFIANFYTGKSENIVDFLSSEMKTEGLELKKGVQAQSTIYESLTESQDIIQVTFVITTTEDSNNIKTIRMTLPVREEEKSMYGYVIVGKPIITGFAE